MASANFFCEKPESKYYFGHYGHAVSVAVISAATVTVYGCVPVKLYRQKHGGLDVACL